MPGQRKQTPARRPPDRRTNANLIAQRIRHPGLFEKIHRGMCVLTQRIRMQVQGSLQHFGQVSPALTPAPADAKNKSGSAQSPPQRRACCCSIANCLREVSLVSVSCSSSLTPIMLVSGLFSSCATPPMIAPIAASLSLCTICCSSFRFTVMSRTEMITPLTFPSASTNWLPRLASFASFPSRCRAPVLRRRKSPLVGNHRVIERSHLGSVTSSISEIFFPQHLFGS